MVPVPVGVELRTASELADAEDDRVLQKILLGEIADERAQSRIEAPAELPGPERMVLMGIPAR